MDGLCGSWEGEVYLLSCGGVLELVSVSTALASLHLLQLVVGIWDFEVGMVFVSVLKEATFNCEGL